MPIEEYRINTLIHYLRKRKYQVRQLVHSNNELCHDIKGNNISGFIYNQTVIADNAKCFDKPSKCPLQLGVPKTQEQIDYLLDRLEFWGTDKGFDLSNTYEHDSWNLDYPEEL